MDKKRYAVVEKYTAPFVQLVMEKNQQESVYGQLEMVEQVLEETQAGAFLSHIGVDSEEKEKLLRRFQDGTASLLDNLIEVIILNQREDLFEDIIKASMALIEKESQEYVVTVRSVQGLSREQKERLRPIIEKKMDLKVRSIREILDPSLIGGFVITANNKTIDLSLKEQLQTMKKNMK